MPELTLLGISHQLFAEAPEEMRRLAESQPVMLMLPEVLRNRGKKRMDSLLQPEDRMLFAAFCVSSYDGLQYMLDLGVSKDRIVLNHRMYTFSNDALDAFREIGFSHFTAPLELNAQELMHRENCDSTMVLYGYLPLMIMANCSHKNFQGCDQKPVSVSLEDRYHKRFPVRNDCSICMNTVYNSLPYEIFHQKELPKFGFEQFRLDFTIENEEETRRVISRYRDPNQIPKEATKGHYKRGVE